MMQSNIFAKAAPLLKEKKFNIDCDAILNFLEEHYKSGLWVYPEVLQTQFGLSIRDAYEVMECCVEAGVVEQNLQVYCPTCQRFIGKHYRTLFDIPEEMNCVHCDNEIDTPVKHAAIVYKVL